MDRDRREERTRMAYDALVRGEAEGRQLRVGRGRRAGGLRTRGDRRVREADAGGGGGTHPRGRRRRLLQLPSRPGPPAHRGARATWVCTSTTLTRYREDYEYPVAFPPRRPAVTLAEVLEERGTRQLHVAETEKYAHVTYFFNGGEEDEHSRRGALPRGLAPRRADLRPQAGDERPRSGRGVRRALDRGGLRLRHHQLRQPGHGRPHGRDRGGGGGGGDRGRVPRPGGRAPCTRAAGRAS